MNIGINSGSLNIDIQGNGELVVIHPSLARSSNDFTQLSQDLLNKNYTVAVINHRGINGSSGNTKNLTLKELAADVAHTIQHINKGPAHVIGHCYSNHIIHVAARYWPGLVKSIIFISNSGIIPGEINPLFPLEYIIKCDPADETRKNIIKKSFFAEKSNPSSWMDGFETGVLQDLMEGSLFDCQHSEWLNEITIPTLFINGLEDKIAPPESAAKLKEAFGDNIKLAFIPDAAHQIIHEQPELLTQKILEFLNSNNNQSDKEDQTDTFTPPVLQGAGNNKRKSGTIGIKFAVFNFLLNIKNRNIFTRFLAGIVSAVVNTFYKNESYSINYMFSRKVKDFDTTFCAKLKKGMQILDYNCGPGAITIDLAKRVAPGKVTGIDSMPNFINLARLLARYRNCENAAFLTTDVHKLPFKDNQFDAVWFYSGMIPVGNPDTVFKELYRVLKPGGILSFTFTDWQADIIYPVYRMVKQVMEEAKRRFKISEALSLKTGFLYETLHKVGFNNLEKTAFTESYGTREKIKEFTEFLLFLIRGFFPKTKVDLGFKMATNTWRAWAEHPDAFFSRTNIQIICYK